MQIKVEVELNAREVRDLDQIIFSYKRRMKGMKGVMSISAAHRELEYAIASSEMFDTKQRYLSQKVAFRTCGTQRVKVFNIKPGNLKLLLVIDKAIIFYNALKETRDGAFSTVVAIRQRFVDAISYSRAIEAENALKCSSAV